MFEEPVLPLSFEASVRWIFVKCHDAGISPCGAFRACVILRTVLTKGRTIAMDLDALAGQDYHLAVPPSVVVVASIAFDLETQELSRTTFGALFVEFTHAIALVRSRYVNAQFEIGELMDWKLMPPSPFERLAFAVSELTRGDACEVLDAAARVVEHAVAVDTLADAHAVAAAAYAVAALRAKRRMRPSDSRRHIKKSILDAIGVFPHAPAEAQDDAETLADLYRRFCCANEHSWIRPKTLQRQPTETRPAPRETWSHFDASSPSPPLWNRKRARIMT